MRQGHRGGAGQGGVAPARRAVPRGLPAVRRLRGAAQGGLLPQGRQARLSQRAQGNQLTNRVIHHETFIALSQILYVTPYCFGSESSANLSQPHHGLKVLGHPVTTYSMFLLTKLTVIN